MDAIGIIISQLERQRTAIDRALVALREIELGTSAKLSGRRGVKLDTGLAEGRPKRKFSAAARKRMALAQRRRYALQREQGASAQGSPAAGKTRATRPARKTVRKGAAAKHVTGRKRTAGKRGPATAVEAAGTAG